MHLWQLRRIGNLLNGSTVLGLAIARLGGAQPAHGPRGMIVAEGYRLRFPVAGAFTVGDVVITASTVAGLVRRHPSVMLHEESHAWQWLGCGGLPFLPLYGLATAWSLARTGNRASANVFEVAAGLERGGYQ